MIAITLKRSKNLLLLVGLMSAALIGGTLSAEEMQEQVDSFGGNEFLYLKAKALNPEVQSQTVQNRFINRDRRFEVSAGAASVFGGDAYNESQSVDLNLHFHLTPHWSFGLRYGYYFNSLTPEGKTMVNRAEQAAAANPGNPNYLFPQVIYPKSESLAQINWYPIVGKLSLGSWGVLHFDTYFLAGYGNIALSSGSSPTQTAGMGLGFWANSQITTRIEYRVQSYKASYYDEDRRMTNGIASIQLGYLL